MQQTSFVKIPEKLHRTLVHTVTEYDRTRNKGPRANIHALPLYLQAVDSAEELISRGYPVREALEKTFCGRLLTALLKATSQF
jgi:hypothetical protein